ncbi:MAG TPA: S4 domain-containing protein YaaA [Pseudogracilibacillus sp.]|nr:S4 domain-containing protein YaaA [Pseudogracilibacillus sp.]
MIAGFLYEKWRKGMNGYMEEIQITGEYVTLSQLLKLTNIFDSGGMIKHYIQDQGVYVNNELEYRRGRKIYPADVVKLDEEHQFAVRVEK